jgi:Fe-S cluster assembly iron-binding protein IscA
MVLKNDKPMFTVTPAALRHLKALIAEHPEDPIVRIAMKDLDEDRMVFSITLESVLQPEDESQHVDGVRIAVEGRSAPRMDGVTLDYQESKGFTFIHPDEHEGFDLRRMSLN